MTGVTHILNAIEAGDANAADRLLPLVYDQLRREAGAAWRPSDRTTRFKPLLWCMRFICDLSATDRFHGNAGAGGHSGG